MMKFKLIAAMTLGVALSACGSMPDIASRNAPFEGASPTLSAGVQTQLPKSMNVRAINVRAPRTLKATEANGYYPQADIVWRGDPVGDRHQQITNIFRSAFAHGTKAMNGKIPVVLDVEINRFHSVTQRTRRRLGGVHNMHFTLTVRSAATGNKLAPTRAIEANLPAFGGRQALAAEARGETQKVRVTRFLSQVIREELSKPVGAPRSFAAKVKETSN